MNVPARRGQARVRSMPAGALVGVVAALTLVALLPAGVVAVPARADSAAAAEARARAVLARVAGLQRQVDTALAAYNAALGGLAGAVNSNVAADQALNAATQQEQDAALAAAGRVRAIYRSGGPMALYASILDGASPGDVLTRVQVVQRMVTDDAAVVASSRQVLSAATSTALVARSAANARSAAAGRVDDIARRLERLLAEQQQLLSSTRATAARLRAAEDAIRAAQASYGAITSERIRSIRPLAMSKEYADLYHAAAATCPGLSWTVLAAIGQVETGHGRTTTTSSAGAQGPMQFMPSTFAAYAVDGNGDGVKDIQDPADSIFTAAHYLCANGAGRGNLDGAIFRYNHAGWYVQLVLTLSQRYA